MGKQKQELPSDPSQYTILKEGQADILMHGNDVFYNKTQVVNRDLSIAVLRTFVAKSKEEYAEMWAKKQGRKMGASGTQAAPVLAACDSSEPGASTPAFDHEINEAATVVNTAHLEKDNGVNNFSNGGAQSEVTDQVCEVSDEIAKPVIKRVREEPRPLRILEALAASGLRALRYAREVEGVGSVVAIDNDKVAVEACKRNIKLNGSVACSKVEAELADAKVYMLTHEKEFDVVDLDPYGSPSVFLDSAVQSVVDGGMLMCTATDMAVLCGNNGEVCYSKYGSYPTRAEYCHEMSLRILLACIESHANRYKRYIVPVLSVKVDFYIRVFVRIFTSASAMKNTPLKLSYVYQCVGCDSFHTQPLARTVNKNNSLRYLPGHGPVVPQECSDCGKKFNMGGPIWSAPIHDPDWVSSILSNVISLKSCYPAYDRIYAIMTSVSEELLDVPLYLCLHNISGTLKCTSPKAVMLRSAIINAGYRVSGTHANPLGFKTDAPMDVIWDIMRCWVQLHPVKSQPSDQSGSVILAKEPTLKANFTRAQFALSHAQCKKVPRFLPNPENYWGPKPRAGRRITNKHTSLMGPEFINNLTCQRESELPDAKRPKLEEADCKQDS
ncbi:tRNA (guanine(26)-N(2))-dimethyltransferase 2 isoform X2 [Cryptomeria japonica]|nr:tRNA (guanine(26)-N(2))-dimethyltransferase 2 isoform X2 [Cryptomeria japonica]XP_057820429.1 tRNA (guanine(26)-N(2))-dimethyltransferase 2 isoform X2 [Cryptomeria japonica]